MGKVNGASSAQNISPAKKKRGNPQNLIHYKPGQSGNPGGRKAMPPEIVEALDAATPRAVARLVELIESNDERVALTAAETVLSRRYGKPVQAVDAKVETTNVTEVHLRALELIEQRRAERLKTIEARPVEVEEIRADQVDQKTLPE